VGVLIRAGVLAGLIYAWIFQVSVVQGNSMYPAFIPSDRVLVDKLTYRIRAPRRFEVVVVSGLNMVPAFADRLSGAGEGQGIVLPVWKDYIKRVVGLPGEVVEFRGGKLIVNGEHVPEGQWLTVEQKDQMQGGRWVVPADRLFVVGDNRGGSNDSRQAEEMGFVPFGQVKGLVRCRFWPLKRQRWFDSGRE
jgi:signal peptidase I